MLEFIARFLHALVDTLLAILVNALSDLGLTAPTYG